jgi:peptidoglycan/LPS O-acetylase OafA/YrhL
LKYRPDIDGLRAIAVGTVVLYHCGFAHHFPGGFIGVDIFFVISGYLITHLLRSDLERGDLSIVDFYNRRARRIFPALFAMYAVIVVYIFVTKLPYEAKSAGNDLIASMLFVSNIAFYFDVSDYFAVASERNTLLHTWSLSVEEQFYVFFPTLLFLLYRLGRTYCLSILLAGLGISLVAASWMVLKNQDAAFYLLQYRAWELLIGAVLALGIVPEIRSRWRNELAAWGGLAMIAGSVFLLHKTSPFPGLLALPTCIGTGLIILSQGTTAARLLALPPIRWIGLISYSLYLWHWPVWVIGGGAEANVSGLPALIYVAVSVMLAAFSWRFIEQPFRTRPYRFGPLPSVRIAGASMIAVILVGLLLPSAITTLRNIPERADEVAAFADYKPTGLRNGTCFLTSTSDDVKLFNADLCLRQTSGRKSILLIGDSHAAHLYPGLTAIAENANILQATASGCKPVLDTKGAVRCTTLMNYIFKSFLPRTRMDIILISARWKENDIENVVKTANALRAFSNRVVVLGPIVEYQPGLPRALAAGIITGGEDAPHEYMSRGPKIVDGRLRAALAPDGIEYLSTYDAICPGDHCEHYSPNGRPIQFDYGHLTENGSEQILKRMAPALLGPSGL